MSVSLSTTRPVVVLTGASSGIGHATALAFAKDGADLVLAARGREALDTVAAECKSAGAQVLVVPTDVADADAVKALAAAAIERFGGIDVWVNNAGIGAVGRFDEVPLEAHRRIIDINLMGQMNGAHSAIGHFRRRGRGTLVNMISVGGWISAPYASAYIASKFALRGFSEAVRAEVSDQPDIHVCAVYPTFVDTPGVFHTANYTGRSLRPPPPLLNPREVADTVVSLSKSPRATVSVGAPALPGRLAHAIAPNLLGRFTRWTMERAMDSADPVPVTEGSLYAPSQNNAVDGGFRKPAAHATGTVIAGAAALGLAWWLASRLRGPDAARPERLSGQ